ncbi:Cyclic nucleotide-binding domain-containing protein [Rubrivivax sp. A210]|nr:Cyclic nucleotide-binding domain-containing protein [Rubrivivax sp. A210]
MEVGSFIAEQSAQLLHLLNDQDQWLALAAGTVAAALIVVSSLVKTIIPLRWLAVGGNIGFIVYGLAHPAPMVAVLHAALLPINLWRVLEMWRLTRRVMRAEAAGSELRVWLQPYMKRRRLRAGAVLFRHGDRADRVYALAEGRLVVVETGRVIEAGEMFGEIGFFAPGGCRSATVRSLQPSTLLSLDEASFRQLFFQNPGFGFEVVRLIAGRLSADVQQLSGEVRTLEARLAAGSGDGSTAETLAAMADAEGAARSRSSSGLDTGV